MADQDYDWFDLEFRPELDPDLGPGSLPGSREALYFGLLCLCVTEYSPVRVGILYIVVTLLSSGWVFTGETFLKFFH